MRRASCLLVLALFCAACQDPKAETPVERGRGIYASNCTSCHAMDPGADGPLGPAVVGSSRELLEARIVRGDYPAGYTPKRDTRVMAPLPHLADEIDSLTAYLNPLIP